MQYEIVSTFINKFSLAEDNSSIDIDVTIYFKVVGDDKSQPSRAGTTINLLLDESARNTLVSELDTKVLQWFNTNYNPS